MCPSVRNPASRLGVSSFFICPFWTLRKVSKPALQSYRLDTWTDNFRGEVSEESQESKKSDGRTSQKSPCTIGSNATGPLPLKSNQPGSMSIGRSGKPDWLRAWRQLATATHGVEPEDPRLPGILAAWMSVMTVSSGMIGLNLCRRQHRC